MKAILMSIQPKWCELIASGKKTVEVRKTKPKLEVPFKCYIYETQGRTETPFVDEEGHQIFKGRGQVIGEFVCDKIDEIGYSPEMHGKYISDIDDIHYVSCVDFEQMFDYLADGYGYGWHISDLVIYDKPKELSEFCVEAKKSCPAYLNGDCLNRTQNKVIRCEHMECEHKKITRPPQSWCYVEGGEGWMKKVKWRCDLGCYIPFCPYCDEPAYEKDKCSFCGREYEWVEGKHQPTKVTVGDYTIIQTTGKSIYISTMARKL